MQSHIFQIKQVNRAVSYKTGICYLVAQALHRVAEEVRSKFLQVDALVSKTKKIFVKAPAHKMQFMYMTPSVSLPPEPVIRRWGMWIDATMYYRDYFQVVRKRV